MTRILFGNYIICQVIIPVPEDFAAAKVSNTFSEFIFELFRIEIVRICSSFTSDVVRIQVYIGSCRALEEWKDCVGY